MHDLIPEATPMDRKMKFNRRHFLGASMAAGAAIAAPASFAAPEFRRVTPTVPAAPKPVDQPEFLQQALAALDRHSSHIAFRDRIGIADFSQHSKEMRFHLANVEAGQIERSFLVSHGRGSDPVNSGFVQHFSNQPGSNASSQGSYLTGDAYYGKHGQSRRLHGLDEVNDKAFARAIVIHGADYVDHQMALAQGRIGRSLGCFAFEKHIIAEVLDRLGEGRLLFAAA